MGSFLSIPIMILVAALQVTVMPQISFLGGRPDLVFLVVVSWALNSTLEEAVVWAFAAGICKDLLSAAPVGTSIIGLILIVFAIHIIRQQLFSVGLFTLIWASLIGTIIQELTILLVLLLLGFQPAFSNQLGYGVVIDQFRLFILPTIVYNLIGILPVYLLMRIIQRAVGSNLRLTR